jgi:hypothetical protein
MRLQTRKYAHRCAKLLAVGVAALIGSAASTGLATLLTIGSWASAPANDTGAPTGTSGSGSSATVTLSGTGGESSDVPFTSQALGVGDSITLTGNVAWITNNIGNIQFRWGLFNTNSSVNDVGFAGYVAEVPNGAITNGILAGIAPNNSNAWQGTGSHYTLTSVFAGHTTNGGAGVGNPPSPTYNFTMSLTETAAGTYAVSASLVASDDATATDFNWSGTATDSTTGAGSSAPNSTFNDFGFFWGSGAGLSATSPNNVITFSNVQVDYEAVPEPASLVLLSFGGLGLTWSLKRRR